MALANNPQSKIYNSVDYPNWKASNNKYDINPNFTDHRIDSLSAILAEWALPAIKNDYFASYYDGTLDFTSLNWYWEPDGNVGQNETWPLFDGTYTNAAALTGGLDGLPIGDLNWFPEKMSLWNDNKQAIDAHILDLNTEIMDLTTSINEAKGEAIKAIVIFPNPTTGQITITENYDVLKIFNFTGQLVKQFSEYNVTQDISDLTIGIYILQFIENGENKGFSKLVKE